MKRTISALIGLTLLGGCSKESPSGANLASSGHHAPLPRRPLRASSPPLIPKASEAAELLVDGFSEVDQPRPLSRCLHARLAPAHRREASSKPTSGVFPIFMCALGDPAIRRAPPSSISISRSRWRSQDTLSSDKSVERHATAVVRRVNDVPGSTEEQRRWHIERIDWEND